MNLFQLITLPVVGFLFFRSIFIIIRGSQPRGTALIGSLIWLVAGITILNPELTIRIAAIFGIGRGADLILYILAILFFLSFFYIYNRFRKLESHITDIVRDLAIREAIQRMPQNVLDINKEEQDNTIVSG